jgi:hypothetical protein
MRSDGTSVLCVYFTHVRTQRLETRRSFQLLCKYPYLAFKKCCEFHALSFFLEPRVAGWGTEPRHLGNCSFSPDFKRHTRNF